MTIKDREPEVEDVRVPPPKYRVVIGDGHNDFEERLNALAEVGYRVIASYLHHREGEGWAPDLYAVMELKEASP